MVGDETIYITTNTKNKNNKYYMYITTRILSTIIIRRILTCMVHNLLFI